MNELCIVACGKKKIWDKDTSAGSVKSKNLYTGIFTENALNMQKNIIKNLIVFYQQSTDSYTLKKL